MQFFDTDAHVEEFEETFSDEYLAAPFRSQRPEIVRGEDRYYWSIEGKLFPDPDARVSINFGTPESKDGIADPKFSYKLDPLDSRELRTVQARLDVMDNDGISKQVVFPTLFLQLPVANDVTLSTGLADAYNAWMADKCSQSNGRIFWVAAIDPRSPDEAAKRIKHAKDSGAVAVMLLGMVGTEPIHRDEFDPIWRACADVDLAAALHPGYCMPVDATFVYSMLIAFDQFMASGILDRYPSLRVAFFEAGCEWVPFALDQAEGRLHANRNAGEEWNPSQPIPLRGQFGYLGRRHPREYVERGNVFFGYEVEDELLPWCVKQYGSEAFLFASDIPHGHRLDKAGNFLLARDDISEADKKNLLVTGGERYYQMSASI